MKNKTIWFIILSIMFVLTSCRTAYDTYIHPLADIPSLKKVAILPFKTLQGGALATEMINDSLTLELLSRGLFEVIPVDDLKDLNIDINSLDTKSLNIIKEKLGCEAVITGTINTFDTNKANIDIVMKMIDTESGIIMWMGNVSYSGKTDLPTFGIGETTSIKALTKKAVTDLVNALAGGK